ncbi:hypothetical protein DD238_002870 [Peronospora effusa]|uniref:CWF21 domain-containing protein n=1 Tax=Peronospora effusa TaxID=542832 RepID=A0A3M6VUI7_9STRA|nr:hypothetical protein DD238_002870 [Peronospora effusa]RQM09840.1 hypothetical protein DD237_002103 [Peronospora effusa]
MYNGIGLRTVRGSGTNGYVQRNLSYVNASRTRQTLVNNQRGGSSEDFGARGGGKNRLPPNAEILLHEKKRKVELHLLEMSLEMEERDCDPEEIEDKMKRERVRLLTRLHDGRDGGQETTKDAESSHARQKRKEEENKRIKDAFGIASDYMVGESFDPKMQERRRNERKERREQEEKEMKEKREKNEKEKKEKREKDEKERKERREKEEKEREEARLLRLKTREEKDAKINTRREPFLSRSRSKLATRSRRSRSLTNRRTQGRDDVKLRKSPSRSSVTERRSRRSSASDKRKRRFVSSSRSSSSSRSRSRSRSRKLRSEKCREKDSQATKMVERKRSRFASRSISSSSSGSGSYRSEQFSRKATVTKGTQLSLGASPARSTVLKGKHKVLNLSKRSASICAVTNDESHENIDIKEEKRSVLSPEREKSAGESSPVVAKREVKHEASSKQKVDETKTSIPAVLPVQVKKEEKTEASRSSRRSPSAIANSRPQLRKRKLRSTSSEDRRRRGRSTSSTSSKASLSPRYRRMYSPSARSRSPSSDSSRSRSRSKSRSRRPNPPRRRGRSSSRSRSRNCGRSHFRNRRY